MPTVERFKVVADGDESRRQCRHCGRPVYAGTGSVEYEAAPVADYWYWWSDGHECRFELAIRFGASGDERVVLAQGMVTDGDIGFGLLDPDASWPSLLDLGRVLTREQALADEWHPEFWDFFDAVAELEPRLRAHVAREQGVT
jgi:hypothetical protein